MGFFRFGKKEKKFFKIPIAIADLRMRIETESRERYPSLASFHELTTKVLVAYQYLNDIIDQKEHEEEATRIIERVAWNTCNIRA